jgi:IS30 family transposase
MQIIHAKLKMRWLPRQISSYLKETCTPDLQAAPETIYQYIYMLTRGELKKKLIRYLRHRKPNRKPRLAKG